MTEKEVVKMLIKKHKELGSLPLSLEEKCKEIVQELKEKEIIKIRENLGRSTKGVF